MNIHERIKSRRKELGLSADEIAAELGVSRATIYRYESADIENMGIDKIEPLARVLHTTPEYLMGWNDDPYDYDRDEANRITSIPSDIFTCLQETYGDNMAAIWKAYQEIENEAQQEFYKAMPKNILPMPHTHKIPVIGTIACGTPILAEQNIDGYEPCPDLINADFCLHCKGDSMINARINDGDTVFIHQQPAVENGEIAAVEIFDGCECEATLKRFYHDGNTVTLVAENPAYAPMTFSNEQLNNIKVIGKAVYFLSEIK